MRRDDDAGGEEFVYQSCTQQRVPGGSMEGDFAFVEGTLAKPGAQIDVECPRFYMRIPAVLFS